MRYRPEIDGLRALAVLPVVLFHAGVAPFAGGYVGVDVFFVISGYLITHIVADEVEAGRFSLLGFYERRARRILPALAVVVLAALPIAWLVLSPRNLTDFAQSLVAVATFSSNLLFWLQSGYFEPAAELKPLLHTWSLAVEEQFYIVFPLLLLALWRFGRRRLTLVLAGLGALSLAAAEHWVAADPAAAFYLLPTRAWELLIGAAIALHPGAERRAHAAPGWLQQGAAAIGLGLILTATLAFDRSVAVPGSAALVPTLGAALVILFARPGTLAHRLLASRPLVGVGLISYSLYLWHQPLFAFHRHWTGVHPAAAETAALIALTFVLAYLTWRFVECPVRNRARVPGRAIAAACPALLAAICVIGLAGHVNQGFASRFPHAARIEAALQPRAAPPACRFDGTAPEAELARCRSFGRVVYLIGDSHAAALAAELARVVQARGYRLIAWTKFACFPIPDTTRLPRAEHRDCARFKDQVFQVLAEHPAPTILAVRWRLNIDGARYDNGEGGVEPGPHGRNVVTRPGAADLTGHVSRELARLARRMPLVVIDQIPEAGWHVPDRLLRIGAAGGDGAALTTSYARYLDANAEVIGMFETLPEPIAVVNTAPLVCDRASMRCRTANDGLPLYADDDHPAPLLARLIAERVDARLPEVLSEPAAAGDGSTP